jgi:hypothetical protein
MFADDIAGILPELRAHAESLMVDSCAVDRADGTTTLDPVTLEEVPNYASVLTDQACRVQRFRGQGQSDLVAGGINFGISALLLQLPLSARGVRRNDRVRTTAVAAISDPELVGTVAVVREDLTKTHATKRLLLCEEVDAT